MKRLFVFFLLLCMTLGLFVGCLEIKRTEAIAIEKTRIIYSETDDGYISKFHPTYSDAQQASSGTTISDDVVGSEIGQQKLTNYYIWRSYLFFDTSIIPDDANITEAKISLYIYSNQSVTDFNITVQNGQPTYPHQPLELGDYDYSKYSGNGGMFDTSDISLNTYNNITLNATGQSWLTLTGTTKLCLRSSRDINATAPTGNEHIFYRTKEIG